MKRHITFPRTILILKPYLWLVLFLFAALITALAFLPRLPPKLTVFDNNQQIYISNCPRLTAIKNPPQKNTKRLTSPFTLLNWNIYKQQKKQWQEELQQWSSNVDLITLQEVKYSAEFNLFSGTANLFHLQNYAFKYNGFLYGVNTLSRQQALSVCGTRDKEPWIRIPKTGIASSYAITNHPERLLLINLHGVNFTFSATPLKEQLQDYFTLIKSHQGPIIFSGDFNTWSDVRLNLLTASFKKFGFSDVRFNNDQRTTVFGHPLDHIYFRGLTVLKAQSLTTTASDHNPQIVTFAFE